MTVFLVFAFLVFAFPAIAAMARAAFIVIERRREQRTLVQIPPRVQTPEVIGLTPGTPLPPSYTPVDIEALRKYLAERRGVN